MTVEKRCSVSVVPQTTEGFAHAETEIGVVGMEVGAAGVDVGVAGVDVGVAGV